MTFQADSCIQKLLAFENRGAPTIIEVFSPLTEHNVHDDRFSGREGANLREPRVMDSNLTLGDFGELLNVIPGNG